VIVSSRDSRTRDFACGKRIKAFCRFERSARLKLDRLETATSLRDLAVLPGNRFETLLGDRKGQYSIRTNDQWWTCFRWPGGSLGPSSVEIVDYYWESHMAVTGIHPGEHLAEELQALDMSAAELARKLGVPTNRVTQILHGTRPVTGDTWLNLQNLYDLRLAQKKAGKSVEALPKLKRRELVHAKSLSGSTVTPDCAPQTMEVPCQISGDGRLGHSRIIYFRAQSCEFKCPV